MAIYLGKRRHFCSVCLRITPYKEPKRDHPEISCIARPTWSTKRLHEQKMLQKFSGNITNIISWSRFVIMVSEQEVMIYQDDFKLHASISFTKNDIPALLPAGKSLLMFGEQDTRQLLWSIDANLIKKEVLEVPLEGIFGFLGCVWNNVLVLGKPFSTQLLVISLEQDEEQCEIIDTDCYPVNMICAKNTLWIIHGGQTKVYNNLDQLRNGSGKSCSSASILCYWKYYDVVATALYTAISLLENKTGTHYISMESHLSSITSLCDWQNRLYSGCNSGDIKVWDIEGKCLDIIQTGQSIQCLCVHDRKLWVGSGNTVAYYKSKRPWKILKVLWLAHCKNTPITCPMSILPRDLIRLIISFL